MDVHAADVDMFELLAEIHRYLAFVDLLRQEGLEPQWVLTDAEGEYADR